MELHADIHGRWLPYHQGGVVKPTEIRSVVCTLAHTCRAGAQRDSGTRRTMHDDMRCTMDRFGPEGRAGDHHGAPVWPPTFEVLGGASLQPTRWR